MLTSSHPVFSPQHPLLLYHFPSHPPPHPASWSFVYHLHSIHPLWCSNLLTPRWVDPKLFHPPGTHIPPQYLFRHIFYTRYPLIWSPSAPHFTHWNICSFLLPSRPTQPICWWTPLLPSSRLLSPSPHTLKLPRCPHDLLIIFRCSCSFLDFIGSAQCPGWVSVVWLHRLDQQGSRVGGLIFLVT